MTFAAWATLAGALLVFMALAGSVLSRLPLSTSMLYLAVGVAVSPWGFDWVTLRPFSQSELLEHLTETVVLVSLFTSGLKLSAGLDDRRWLPPLRLAVLSMIVTVAAIAAVGVLALGLPLGAAVLLGGILAPTDPVLASDVQVEKPRDRDRLRFALTGEGGLNDGTAFPVVMLGLGLLGLHELGPYGWRWLAVDVVWASACGLAAGAALGTAVGQLVLHLRRTHREAVGFDNFLALGLIGLAYGVAVLANGYGFLAVFAAGVALRRTERRATAEVVGPDAADDDGADDDTAADRTIEAAHADPDAAQRAEALATDRRHAPAFMAHAMLNFNEQLDRVGEVAAVTTIGLVLWAVPWSQTVWWFPPLLLLVIRPLAVMVGLGGRDVSPVQKRLIGWFGIRGVGSLYYLAYALTHDLPDELAGPVTALTLSVVVTSIVVHGISVTPLMAFYKRSRRRRR